MIYSGQQCAQAGMTLWRGDDVMERRLLLSGRSVFEVCGDHFGQAE